MKLIYTISLIILFASCSLFNGKNDEHAPPRSRSFTLTQDSTFIGVWIADYNKPQVFDKMVDVIYGFSKDSLIYLLHPTSAPM